MGLLIAVIAALPRLARYLRAVSPLMPIGSSLARANVSVARTGGVRDGVVVDGHAIGVAGARAATLTQTLGVERTVFVLISLLQLEIIAKSACGLSDTRRRYVG